MSAPSTGQSADSGVIDLVHLRRQTGGDRELEREVLGLFREQCARMLPLIAQAQQVDGRLAVEGGRAAHTLKGAALGIGANRVAAAAAALEHEGGAVAYAALQQAASEACAAIAQMLASG